MRITALSLLMILCAVVLSVPAFADFYNNGPTNYTYNAYYIDTYAVSDSFPGLPDCSEGCGFEFALWVPARAVPLTVEWSIGSTSFGSDVASGVTGGGILVCGAGCSRDPSEWLYIVQTGWGFPSDKKPSSSDGTYWLTLTGATDSLGGRDGWDVNSGPSQAFHSVFGAIPSEAFTISQCPACSVPEPSSFLLFGSGILGLASILRRRLNL